MLKAILNVLKQKPPINPSLGPEEVRQYAVQAAKRARVGSGQFGQVYEVSPGVVVKEIENESKQKLLQEINAQAKAAEMGIAPAIKEVNLGPLQAFGKTFPLEEGPNPRMRGEIQMQDLRQNYAPLTLSTDELGIRNPALTQQQYNKADLETSKQVAQLALQNISLGDRHGQNIFVNTLTGRPLQIDFGLASTLTNTRQKAASLGSAVSEGLRKANLMEEASIFKGLINELIYTDPDAALDIAKQGLSRLQKIKKPINPQIYNYATVNKPEDFIPTY